ncbi:MAG: DUF1080 domain-containing protein [bacterium]|nr:DUF1080 domain-containing protein [bacterium]
MKEKIIAFCIFYCCLSLVSAQQTEAFKKGKKPKHIVLFNGKNLKHWQGDMDVWHIENGAITAGDTSIKHLQNDFLATKKDYKNFVLTLKFKLEGGPGFVNSGVQVNSQRNTVAPLNEMVGFQADIGPGYTGSLYDETRRDIILAKADSSMVEKLLHKNDWNDYEIRCIDRRIVIILNGFQTIDYTEPENDYPDFGKIGLQIHSNAKMKISFKDIILDQF